MWSSNNSSYTLFYNPTEEVVSDRNFLMDLDHIERCATPESEKSRSHLKLQLFRDYSVSDASKNSLASSPKSTRSKVSAGCFQWTFLRVPFC